MLLYPADAEPPLVEFELELLFVDALAAAGPTEDVAPADAGGFKLAVAVAAAEFDTWSAGSCSGTVGNVNIMDFFLCHKDFHKIYFFRRNTIFI